MPAFRIVVAAVLVSIAVYLFGYTVGRIHRRIHFNRFGLSVLVAASLSGCLTAAKIGEWQRAVYGWGMSEGASQACKDAADSAAQYIAKANTDLLGTGKLTDLSSDIQAKQLLNSAALACGKAVP